MLLDMAKVQPFSHNFNKDEAYYFNVTDNFVLEADAILYHGDCLNGLRTVPDDTIKLIVTSPPYNLGKGYEDATNLDTYFETLSPIMAELVRVLSPEGSLCWQVGNYVDKGEIFPLDILYYPFFKRLGL